MFLDVAHRPGKLLQGGGKPLLALGEPLLALGKLVLAFGDAIQDRRDLREVFAAHKLGCDVHGSLRQHPGPVVVKSLPVIMVSNQQR